MHALLTYSSLDRGVDRALVGLKNGGAELKGDEAHLHPMNVNKNHHATISYTLLTHYRLVQRANPTLTENLA